MEILKDLVEGGVFVAGGELASEGKEEIDLEENLRGVDAIEETVELGGV